MSAPVTANWLCLRAARAGQHQQAVVEVAVNGGAYQVVQQCSLDFNLSGGDSGLSAIRFHTSPQGERGSMSMAVTSMMCGNTWLQQWLHLRRMRLHFGVFDRLC